MAATETFANNTVAVVTSGGTTAPAPGTVETWTLSGAVLPAASAGVTQFHVADVALPSEKILVTNLSGPTATVTRGAEGTAPVAHSAGFTIRQVLTAGVLSGLVTGAPSGPAGGDLSGTYPNPTVTQTHLASPLPGSQGGTGITGSGTPALGQVLMATSSSAAKWASHPVDWVNAVTAYGADPTGVADSTTAIQNAVTAAAAARTTAYLPAGTYLVSSTITNSTGAGSLVGAGRWGTIISFTGTGDAIRWYNSTYGGSQPGGDGSGVRDLRIDGTSAGAGSTGLHTGDQTALRHDVVITNFSGAGSIGVHLDNTIWWTEEQRCHYWVYNCTSGVVFDVTGATTSTNSFGYSDIDIYVNCGPNQNGVVLQNGAYVYNNARFRVRGNFTGSSSAVTNSALTITGTVPTGHPNAGSPSRLFSSGIDFVAEVTGTFAFTPRTVTFGSGSNQLTGSGTIHFNGFTNSATTLGASAQVIFFDGFFLGDSSLNDADTPLGPVEFPIFTSITTGFPAGWSGHIRYRRLGNMRVQIDWALSVASGTVLTPGTVIAAMPAGYYFPSDTKTVVGDLSAGGHFYCPFSIASTGSVSYQGPSQTLATTAFIYGQAEYNIAV